MGWMEPYLIPAWARYVNDTIHQQCESFPGRPLGACQLPQIAGAPDLPGCIGALNRFIPTDPHTAQKDLSNNLFYDTCGYDLIFLEAAIRQRGVSQMLSGTKAPGSGRAVRPETGRTCDDLVPVIGGFSSLTEDDKLAIFNANPARVIPALVKTSR
jgi:hypothetical protein